MVDQVNCISNQSKDYLSHNWNDVKKQYFNIVLKDHKSFLNLVLFRENPILALDEGHDVISLAKVRTIKRHYLHYLHCIIFKLFP